MADVVYEARPHWRYLLGPGLALVATVVLLVAGGLRAWPEVVVLVLAVVVLVALIRFVVAYCRWATTSLVVAVDRIVHRRGVLGRRSTEIPLEQINTVVCRQSLLDRVLSTGELEIDAGETGGHRFVHVARPGMVRGVILEQVPPSRRLDALERLDGLRRRGAITQGEFENEKARLLRGGPSR